jgi:hypothetical protein
MPSTGAPAAGPDNARLKARSWRVPVLIGTERTEIAGVVEWIPTAASGREAARAH